MHYLVVANHSNASSRNINSVVYRWDTGSSQFVNYKNIPTHGALDWEHFEINGVHYLVVAYHGNGSSHNINSVLY